MKPLSRSFSLLLAFFVLQVQGEEAITVQVRISASENPPDEVWVGVFSTPVRPKAEALSWNTVDSPEFELAVPHQDEVQLVVLSRDFLPLIQTIHPLSSNVQFELQLKTGIMLEGTVLSTDKISIPDAVLTMERRDLPNVRIPDHFDFSWVSNAHGGFKIGGLAPNIRYLVEVEVPNSNISNESFSIQVSKGDNRRRHLQLSNAYFVLGRVVDPVQDRVLDTTVRAQSTAERRGGEFWRTTAITDAEGKFRLGPFVRSLEMWLTATHEDWGTSQGVRTSSGDHDVELVLESLVHVRGTVTDKSLGKLINDFTLKAVAEEVSRDYPHSGAKGEISAMVDRNTMGLIVDSEEHTAYFKLNIDLASVVEYDMGAIVLERGRQLTGKIYDESSGQPIVGATVRLQVHDDDQFEADHFWSSIRRDYLRKSVQSTSDDNGMYELAPLPIHLTHIVVSRFEYLRNELLVDEGVTQIDIPLTKDPALNTRIWGRIVTDVGEPAQGTVVFETTNSSAGYGVYGDGSFDHVMEANHYDIYAITDHGRSDKVSVALAEGETQEVTLVVKSEGRITGIIEGLADGETASLSIRAESEGIGSRQVRGLGNGNFVVEGIGRGKFVLTATTNRNREQQKPFEVSEAIGEANVELYVTGQSRLYGSLMFSDGSIPKGEVKAVAKDSGKTSGSSDINDDGTIEINGLEDGEYTIVVIEHKQVSFTNLGGGSSRRGTSSRIDERDMVISGDTELNIQLTSPAD